MPNPSERDESQYWIEHASGDLRMAELAFAEEEPVVWAGLFHAQQCIEKALKAFLIYSGQNYPLTHNLRRLLDDCAAIDPDMQAIAEPVVELTAFAVQYRYPSPEEMTIERGRELLVTTCEVFEALRERVLRT